MRPAGPGIIIFHPNEGGQTCDEAMVACAIPRAWFTANPGTSYAGARFFRIVDGQRVRADDAGENGWLSTHIRDDYDTEDCPYCAE